MTRIAHILGDWSRNIGNAFFQLGGLDVLRRVSPTAEIMLISEQPGYPSYWNPQGGNPPNSLEVASNVEVDYLVLMGPMFRRQTESIWGTALGNITAKGTRIILLGIGAMKYDAESIAEYRRFLKKYPPYVLVSRDHETFEKLGDLASHAYDGIDFGFFMPEVYKPVGFGKGMEDFVAVNFDKIPEPAITTGPSNAGADTPPKEGGRSFEFGGMAWQIEERGFRKRLSEYSRYLMFLEGILFRGNRVQHIGKYKVVRTEHRAHPMIPRKTFRYPNVVVSDTPYIYAEIYSQAAVTLATRVHACVVALAYGRPAMLFSKTPRVRLLERMGLSEIKNLPVELGASTLQREKAGVLAFLKSVL